MRHVKIIETELPLRIRGFIVKCNDYSEYYTIFINSSISESSKWDALLKELKHIGHEDFNELQALKLN